MMEWWKEKNGILECWNTGKWNDGSSFNFSHFTFHFFE